MKKFFYLAAALAFASCSSDEFLGDKEQNANDGAIHFGFDLKGMSKANQVGATAATTLGGNFIVEGFKGSEGTNVASKDVVFDNYLVVWGENTAGKTEDNTNDWRYVGVDHSGHMTSDILNGVAFNRTVRTQTIKYWDYSQPQYDFVAYSAGPLDMIATDDPVNGTSVKVTKINDQWRTTTPSDGPAVSYTFTAASAADFLNCYITDVTTVKNTDYNKPVTLTFKSLGAKVRVGLYETIPGYSVKDVEFYQDGLDFKFTKVSDPAKDGEGKLTTEYYSADGSTTYAVGDAYDSGKEYYSKSDHADAVSEATFFLTGTNVFPEAGSIKVSYPLLGTENKSKNGYKKADVTVDPESGSTTTTKTFGALTANYTGKGGAEAEGNYLGRTLAAATMAGTAGDKYYTAVIPVSTGAALTLRCNYTLVSTDGSGETIKVWGAKAVVPANYCEWQPNYAYTYIFKISDNTNGSTEKLGGDKEGLFPITFDAVVADFTDVNGEQTTVTTVATPSVTTYQAGHKGGQEYGAGDIYVEVMKEGVLADLSGMTTLYTTTDNTATEADVIDALQMNVGTGTDVVGRNGLTLVPEATAIDLGAHNIPAVDGTTISVEANKSGKFTAVASKNYVFVYDYTTGDPDATVLYSYDNAASVVGATAPSDWKTDDTNPYYTKNNDGTYTQVTGTFTASTAEAPQYYYKKYTNNNRTYAVKVIKTGTTY